jgi:hypothetical protein
VTEVDTAASALAIPAIRAVAVDLATPLLSCPVKRVMVAGYASS